MELILSKENLNKRNMKVISWNTRGILNKSKQLALKGVLKLTYPDVLIQETKQETIDNSLIKALWSSKDIGWDYIESNGRSGGMLTMWDESKISVSKVIKGRYVLSFKCKLFARSLVNIMKKAC